MTLLMTKVDAIKDADGDANGPVPGCNVRSFVNDVHYFGCGVYHLRRLECTFQNSRNSAAVRSCLQGACYLLAAP